VAKPDNAQDGSLDLMVWKCIIPGKPGVCNFFYISLWLFFLIIIIDLHGFISDFHQLI
jgi:hypothetical protein